MYGTSDPATKLMTSKRPSFLSLLLRFTYSSLFPLCLLYLVYRAIYQNPELKVTMGEYCYANRADNEPIGPDGLMPVNVTQKFAMFLRLLLINGILQTFTGLVHTIADAMDKERLSQLCGYLEKFYLSLFITLVVIGSMRRFSH